MTKTGIRPSSCSASTCPDAETAPWLDAFDLLAGPGAGGDGRASRGKLARYARADPPSASGDEGDLAVELALAHRASICPRCRTLSRAHSPSRSCPFVASCSGEHGFAEGFEPGSATAADRGAAPTLRAAASISDHLVVDRGRAGPLRDQLLRRFARDARASAGARAVQPVLPATGECGPRQGDHFEGHGD